MDQEIEESIQAKAVTKDEILLAALKLFTSKGYFKTSLTDIAELLGTKYQHYLSSL